MVSGRRRAVTHSRVSVPLGELSYSVAEQALHLLEFWVTGFFSPKAGIHEEYKISPRCSWGLRNFFPNISESFDICSLFPVQGRACTLHLLDSGFCFIKI